MNEKISFDFQSAAAFNATSRSVCCRLLHAFRRGTRANRCIGASDVAGWFGVLHHQTWPAQLEEMLKAKGYNVQVKNAGKPGDTPCGLLRRLDSAVPSGTKIVILAKEGLYNNAHLSQLIGDTVMNRVETKLKSRGITIIPANAGVVLQNPRLSADDVHLNAAGHKELATRLLPLVISALGSPSPSG